MKKYLVAVAALGILAACSGKQTQVPVEVAEESVTVAEIPIVEAPPVMPIMKAKPAKAINMRDSLKANPKKGPVIQKRFKTTIPVAKTAVAATSQTAPSASTTTSQPMFTTDVNYEMTLYYQDNNDEGVYEFDAVTIDPAAPQTFVSIGKHKKHKKHRDNSTDAEAFIYEFIPSDGSPVFYYEADGNSLILLDQNLQPATSDLNYTLQLLP
ncbi:MAG: copper resistance protein NlpE [Tannerellaceae bacterium]